MKTKPCIAFFLFTFIRSVSAADSKSEQAVRYQDAQWSKAAESKDLEKLVSFYADDAVVLLAQRRDRDHERFNSKHLSKIVIRPRRCSELEADEGDGNVKESDFIDPCKPCHRLDTQSKSARRLKRY